MPVVHHHPRPLLLCVAASPASPAASPAGTGGPSQPAASSPAEQPPALVRWVSSDPLSAAILVLVVCNFLHNHEQWVLEKCILSLLGNCLFFYYHNGQHNGVGMPRQLCFLHHFAGRFANFKFQVVLHNSMCRSKVIIIIKGHSLRRACLQPATNTQSSKPRPPTTNAKSKGKLQNKIKHCSKLSTG